ncbi:hypothetical protein FBPa1_0066 [Pseudomonas phage vB_PaeP_FBPa1]|nr:hypothetical protein FBPa1_0066 [Pseudomonas phage vB_PaeP_FBPa1]
MAKYQPEFDASKVARFYHIRAWCDTARVVRFYKTTFVGFLETDKGYWVVDQNDLKELEFIVKRRGIDSTSDVRDFAKEHFSAFLALKDGSTKRARKTVMAAYHSMLRRRERQLSILERDINVAQTILLGSRMDNKIFERLELLDSTQVEIPSSWDIDQQILTEHKRLHENEGHEEGALAWNPDF